MKLNNAKNFGDMEYIKVDIIEVNFRLFKSKEFARIRFEERYNPNLLPRTGEFIYINDTLYQVRQLTYYPFGDCNGQIGVKILVESCE